MSTSVHHKRKFFDYFPIPKFLEMPSVGIDISDQAVRFVEIVQSGSLHQQLRLKSYGEKKIPEGAIVGGFINKPEEVKKILSDIQKEHKFKFACVSLPEEKGYLFKTELPDVEQKYIAENIEFKLEDNVPINASKAVFDFSLIPSHDPLRRHDAVVTVVPNKVIDVYYDLFAGSSCVPVSFDLVTQAVARAVVPRDEKETCLIIYVGDSRTGFGIVSDGALQFTSTVNVGRATDQFDLLKKQTLLKEEVSKLVQYWQDHKEKDHFKKVLLSGKDAAAVGLKESLAEAAGCTASLANVWVNVVDFKEQIPDITFEESLDYAPAIGLALSSYHA